MANVGPETSKPARHLPPDPGLGRTPPRKGRASPRECSLSRQARTVDAFGNGRYTPSSGKRSQARTGYPRLPMIQVVKLTQQGTLKLPADLAARFQPRDRFAIWAEGDTLHLKRITAPPVTRIVEQADPSEPMPEDELNDIIHELRRRPVG